MANRPGRKVLKNGRTVAQQAYHDATHTGVKKVLVGDMDAETFAAFAAANPDNKMVQFRLRKEGK